MKLKEFRVKEFKSIWDSGSIAIDNKITCLVGKNEAGKTALLHALYRTNPIIPQHAVFDPVYDYPKSEVEDYRIAVENDERYSALVVDCVYELDDSDKTSVEEIFGKDALIESCFRHSTYYEEGRSFFSMEANDAAARNHLAAKMHASEDVEESLRNAQDWKTFLGILDDVEQTTAVKDCRAVVKNIMNSIDLARHIVKDILWPRVPKYLYFDEYYQMKGQENLNALVQRDEENKLKESDRPLLGLISLSRLNHSELLNSKNTTELKNRLEGAGNYLTRRIVKYWSQNKHIQMKFDVRDAKSEDPPGMRQGTNIWGEIYDSVHLAHTPLKSRSRGFVWFFSFLSWYEDVKRKKQNVFLLLDEPGLSLHGRAQADLLRYFEEELAEHQIIYSTHSPFMIDPQHFERVRIVQDLGIDSRDHLPKEQDGTKVLTNVFDATDDSLFPLQGALGYEIHQTLLVGPNVLVVEGPSDMLYLRALSDQLDREGRTSLSEKWTLTPVGGIGKVAAFVALLAPQSGMNVAVLLDVHKQDRRLVEELYKKKLLKKKKVLTYADVLNREEADVEDLFAREFYVSLVNREYCQELREPLKISIINEHVPRTVVAVEQYFVENPLNRGIFGHYRPARYFFENIGTLWSEISDDTKDNVECLFSQTNALLRRG